MHPALKRVLANLALAALVFGPTTPARAVSPGTLDPTTEELLGMGPNGEAIQQARTEVLAILSQSNSCSVWFVAAEPDIVEKFRSLRFAVDENGASDIKRVEGAGEESGYYQPYVASTGQNIGWGSTITINAHGAFFKRDAPVRVVSGLRDVGYYTSFRSLVVSDYAGASLQARVLTMLHELGHIVNLLPLDAGVPSGPQLSVRNTEEVIRHCGAQVRAHKKPSKLPSANSGSAPSASFPPFALIPKPLQRGRFSQ
jgi:hypothetical protein